MGGYEHDGGWIDNTTTGRENVNGATIKTGRLKLLVQPSDALKATLLVLHQNVDQDNQNFGIDGKTTGEVPWTNSSRYDLVNAVITYDLGGTLITESAGYLNSRLFNQEDLGPYYLPILNPILQLPSGFITQIPYPTTFETHTFNDELRFSSQGHGSFHWTAGGWFQKLDSWANSRSSTAPGTLPFDILALHAINGSSAAAVFGEASYDITTHLNALVGLRYFRDRENLDLDTTSLGFPAHDVENGTFHSLDPRFNLSYQFSRESMVYFNAAKGFRSGGFNPTSSGRGVYVIPPTYKPDSLWSYELGTKQQLFEHKLELAADGYYTDWKDVQSNFYAPGSPITVVSNGGTVTGWGTDLTLTARPVGGLTLSASYGWNNLAYRVQTADKNIGDPVDYAVHQSWSASVDYRHLLFGTTSALVRVDYQHAGTAQITLRDFGGQIVHLPERSLVGARLGLDFGRYEAAIVATNLFNDRHVIIPAPFGVYTENLEQRPRTIGVNVSAHF